MPRSTCTVLPQHWCNVMRHHSVVAPSVDARSARPSAEPTAGPSAEPTAGHRPVPNRSRPANPASADVDAVARIDLWLALAAGAEAWHEGDRPAPGAHHIETLAIVAAASWPVTVAASGIIPVGPREYVLVAIVIVVAMVMVAPLIGPDRIRRFYPPPPGWAALRIACVIGGVTCGAALLPGLALLGAWPLGVAAGLDIARTAQVLGITVMPRLWWRRAALSAAHVGVLLGVLAVIVIGEPTVSPSRAYALYGTGVLLSIAAAFTLAATKRDRNDIEARLDAHMEALADSEFRRRGHWLHDDVCSEIRLTRLRLESGMVQPESVATELDELDHRLRLRQLDEFLSAREVRVAEVVQPFLRRAQQQGLVVVDSPTLDTAGRTVDTDTGRRLQRVLAVVVSNALQAGAHELAVRLTWDGPELLVEIEDDAGGFQGEPLVPGRGLEALADELGSGNLDVGAGAKGARIRARLVTAAPDPGPVRPAGSGWPHAVSIEATP
jgi:hypothetical protein